MKILDKLEALETNASQPKWIATSIYHGHSVINDEANNYIVSCNSESNGTNLGNINAEFIAEMRNNIKAVLNVVRAAEQLTDWTTHSAFDELREAFDELEKLGDEDEG